MIWNALGKLALGQKAVKAAYSVTAATGSFTWNGVAATLVQFAVVPADAGTFSWTGTDRKSTRLNSSHVSESRMPSSA